MSLTGKTRWRIQRRLLLGDLVILQVEEARRREYLEGGRLETSDFTIWRDARPADVMNARELATQRQIDRNGS